MNQAPSNRPPYDPHEGFGAVMGIVFAAAVTALLLASCVARTGGAM